MTELPFPAKTCLVIGANRGIGLALCSALLARGDRVLATCRKTSPELEALATSELHIHPGIDVIKEISIAALTEQLGGQPIDSLIINAGIYRRGGFDDFDSAAFDDIRETFEVNALAPLRMTRALVPNLVAGSKIAIITSLMGSMGDNGSGGSYGYRMSKAAVNAAGVSLARDLAPRKVAVALLHPGMVATDMTGGVGILPQVSATGLLARLDELTLENSGGLWHQDGCELPW